MEYWDFPPFLLQYMHNVFLPFIAAMFLVLTACNPPKRTERPVPIPSQEEQVVEALVKGMPIVPTEKGGATVVEKVVEEVSDEGSNVPVQEGRYAAYEEGVIGNGETSVLYFKADWCPYCVRQHAELQRSYTSPLSTYYLNYDTEGTLKARYGVVQQHTFVKIDGEGNKVDAISFPDAEKLSTFLSE